MICSLVTFILTQLPLLPLADVGSSFRNIATLLASFAGGVFGFMLVILGYLYLTSGDDAHQAMAVKRALGAALVGLILILLGVGLATQIVSQIN